MPRLITCCHSFSMFATTGRRLLRSHNCTYTSAAASPHSTATSLSQAVRQAETVDSLDLQRSPDLLCVNLLCEKVGDPCICRLSRVLERLQHLQRLNLANNQLISLLLSILNGMERVPSAECCLGSMTWGQQNTEQEAHHQLSYAFDLGVNFLDTAEM